jgi:Rieske Fe-S protein
VDWDASKGGWLCPCHGSAFSGEGKVRHPPAVDDLKTLPFEDTGDAISFEPV